MNEVKFLIDQIKTTFNGDSWHGPNLIQTLEGIDAKQATERSLGERHNIWELVDHTTFWVEATLHAVKRREMPDPEKVADWPRAGSNDKQWKESIVRLQAAVNMLVEELATWTNEDLKQQVPGKPYNFQHMLHGMIHHNLYHAGQIAILKKKAD